MKQFFSQKLAALFVALVMVLALTTPASLAAAACRVSFSDPSVTVGNNVTINVSVSGSVAGATIRMNYDQSYLQYVSGNLGYGSGGGGMVVLDNENTSAGNMSFSMTFKALKTGSTTVTCASYDIVDGNGDPMAVTMGQSAVTINAAPTASSNNNLSSLSISPGTLSPGFSAGTTSYKAWVSNSTTSVAVYAKTQDGKAKMVYWGNSDFKVGDNTVTVQVTAENGAKKYYTITVNRAAGSTGGNTGGNTDTKPDNTPVPTP
ncbi:cadherin-like beta sandwich domain-containing protein, partial [Pseudoflavonifractor capillosus]|uniref:cadherin-like beta sandwich domain-containing protein n=1 Tax=Pseudoflavonifractor capillosus TaxID=106588 RepID=UPI00195D649F